MTSIEKISIMESYGRVEYYLKDDAWEMTDSLNMSLRMSYRSVYSMYEHVKKMMWVRVFEIEGEQ